MDQVWVHKGGVLLRHFPVLQIQLSHIVVKVEQLIACVSDNVWTIIFVPDDLYEL